MTGTISPEARRMILVAAWEEDAVFDLLRNLARDFGGERTEWLAAIVAEARLGSLSAYRHAKENAGEFADVDEAVVAGGEIGRDYHDAVYLCRTETTHRAILDLPHPSAGDSLRVIGLWPPDI